VEPVGRYRNRPNDAISIVVLFNYTRQQTGDANAIATHHHWFGDTGFVGI
jgi:hypothetical protein